MRPSHVVVRLAIAVGYVLTLSGAAPAWGLGLTGVWFGEQQCDRFDGKKFSTPFKNDIMAITQVGADARMAALCTPVDDSLACGLFYQGTVIDSSKDGDRKGEAGFSEQDRVAGIPGSVLADLGEQHRGGHRSDPGEAGEDWGVRVVGDGGGDRVIELGQLAVEQLQ